MKNKSFSLQTRIFVFMLLIVVLASILIVSVTVFQNRSQAKEYHINRLERKEHAIKKSISYKLKEPGWSIETDNLKYIFRDKIFEISNTHRLEINFFDFDGNLLISSRVRIRNEKNEKVLSKTILQELKNDIKTHRVVRETLMNGEVYKTSYSYIYDNKNNPIGIVSIPYIEESKFLQNQLNDFLRTMFYVFMVVLIIAILIAHLLSRYISHSITTVSEKMIETRLNKRNEKIDVEGGSREIHNLVNAYNSMIDQLEESAVKLAKSEREQAWREMAKQVAHEIKNPLTPMRLTVQSFERRFIRDNPESKEDIREFSKTMIQQIDTMTTIASAFSDFAKMPKAKKSPINIVEVTKHAVDIFSEEYISFLSEKEEIIIPLDKTQLIRIITNLVTNANQALQEDNTPRIEVRVLENDSSVQITVSDNGKGIPNDFKSKVFEPKFTTKTSGMGLGLPMVKNIIESYNGSISFISEENKGTVFTVVFPK